MTDETKPLTEDELRGVEAVTDTDQQFAGMIEVQTVRRMAAELRRLRDDGWLVNAIDEMLAGYRRTNPKEAVLLFFDALEKFRRHRDGRRITKPDDLTRAAHACPTCGGKPARMSFFSGLDGRAESVTYHHDSGDHTVPIAEANAAGDAEKGPRH
jgi:hypothetical protein